MIKDYYNRCTTSKDNLAKRSEEKKLSFNREKYCTEVKRNLFQESDLSVSHEVNETPNDKSGNEANIVRESYKRKSIDMLSHYVNRPGNRRGSDINPLSDEIMIEKIIQVDDKPNKEGDITNESEIQQENQCKKPKDMIVEAKKSSLRKYSLTAKKNSHVNEVKLNKLQLPLVTYILNFCTKIKG